MTIYSKTDLPRRRRGGNTSEYAWVCQDMLALTDEDFLEVEIPEGKNFRTVRNCVIKQLQRKAPKPPKGQVWRTQTITSDDGTKTIAIFMEKNDNQGVVASWGFGGTDPVS